MQNYCPIHMKPWREGKYGPYCPTKMEDGTWCKQKPMVGGAQENTPRQTNKIENQDPIKRGHILGMNSLAGSMLAGGHSPDDVLNSLATLRKIVNAIDAYADPRFVEVPPREQPINPPETVIENGDDIPPF